MRLNANQILSLDAMVLAEDFFHVDILGTNPLDSRVAVVRLSSFDGTRTKEIEINENGTVSNL